VERFHQVTEFVQEFKRGDDGAGDKEKCVSRMRERLVRAVDPGAMTQRLMGSETFRLDDFSFGHKVLKPFFVWLHW
jgi:hypothetical protein